jgi:hypothetical protein
LPKLPVIALICLYSFILSIGGYTQPTENFSVRGLDLGRYEPDRIITWIDQAAENDINTLTFSHDISMDWWELFTKDPDESDSPDPEDRAGNIEAWCQYANSRGMEVYLWHHAVELGEDIGLEPPSGVLYSQNGILYLDFDNPDLMNW